MRQPSKPWPGGLVAGALFAGLLAVPVFVIMGFDCAAGASPADPARSGGAAALPRPLRMQAHGAFFAGTIAVRASYEQRSPPVRQSPGVNPTRHSSLVRLRLENRSADNVTVEILGIATPWGALASDPRRLILAPHQSSTVDSAVAAQAVDAGSVTMAVALEVDGSVETRKLQLSEPALAQAGD